MKAISLRQPFADLVVRGLKDIENRSWTTKHRGPVLIHAGKTLVPCRHVRSYFGPHHTWQHGGIIGIAELVDVVSDSTSPWAVAGQKHFVLKNAKRVPFVPCSGKLSLFEVPWPAATPAPLSPPVFDEKVPTVDDEGPGVGFLAMAMPTPLLHEIVADLGDEALPDDERQARAAFVARYRGLYTAIARRTPLSLLQMVGRTFGVKPKRDPVDAATHLSWASTARDDHADEPTWQVVCATGLARRDGWEYFLGEGGHVMGYDADADAAVVVKENVAPPPNDETVCVLNEDLEVMSMKAADYIRLYAEDPFDDGGDDEDEDEEDEDADDEDADDADDEDADDEDADEQD